MSKSGKQIIFETERLIVRPYSMDDFKNFYRLNGDEDVMRFIRPAQSKKQSKEFLQKIIAAYAERPGMGRWGMFLKNKGGFVGSFAIIPVENSKQSDSYRMQLGYALVKESWGKGYATEAVKGGLQYAFGHLKLIEIAGITYPENVISQKVLLKNGFVFDKIFFEEERELHLYICRR
jgi:ribosomal-protein-alanine N-acetyltransferase